jgi:hypothetical protein
MQHVIPTSREQNLNGIKDRKTLTWQQSETPWPPEALSTVYVNENIDPNASQELMVKLRDCFTDLLVSCHLVPLIDFKGLIT